jgi:hypothetical protein
MQMHTRMSLTPNKRSRANHLLRLSLPRLSLVREHFMSVWSLVRSSAIFIPTLPMNSNSIQMLFLHHYSIIIIVNT